MEMRIGVYFINIRLKTLESFGLDPLIAQTVLERVNACDVIAVLV